MLVLVESLQHRNVNTQTMFGRVGLKIEENLAKILGRQRARVHSYKIETTVCSLDCILSSSPLRGFSTKDRRESKGDDFAADQMLGARLYPGLTISENSAEVFSTRFAPDGK